MGGCDKGSMVDFSPLCLYTGQSERVWVHCQAATLLYMRASAFSHELYPHFSIYSK